jgi:hypothetical protein
MSDDESSHPGAGKDKWDKLAILLHPVGGLLTAVAVASLGLIGSRALDRQQNTEARLRLYSELMSRREESESNLRKEMFQSIIGSFFDPGASSMEAKLLKMELLAQNFNEALDLTPLFLHLHREIADLHDPPAVRRAYETRLSGLAQEVIRKQMIVLEAGGQRHDWTVLLSDSLLDGSSSQQLDDVTLALDGIQRRFRLTVMKADTAQRLVHVSLETETLHEPGVPHSAGSARYVVDFDVGFFDSPMIDNTRLSEDQRVAIVLTDLNAAGASLSLVYFRGSRASREKPYYEEILQKLTDTAGRLP